MQTKVAIVKAGEWGNRRQSEGHNDELVERLERWLNEARWGTDDQPAAEVRVVKTTDEALAWVAGRGAIVYVSRGMAEEAKKIATEHRYIRVTLFTGLIPDEEVVFVQNNWISSAKQVQDVVLR